MLFNSTAFAIFFTVVFVIYWLLHRWRAYQNLALLIGSLFFYYQFHYSFPLYLLALITIGYIFGMQIGKAPDPKKKKTLFIIGACLLSFGLVYLKYSDLLLSGIPILSTWKSSALGILIPIGISYYTFSSIGYITDVYRGDIEPEGDYVTYAAYISFFPHILSGPIPTATVVLPQFKEKSRLTAEKIDQSVGEIVWGLFKKMVVSDNIGTAVSYCFRQSHDLNGSTLLLGSILFTIQVYADFSGYSDIARGLAGLLGIEIPQNFKIPFSSRSVTEFWRRWHISLTTWFYTYIFNPLVDSLRFLGNSSIVIALIFTFCLSGLWHGADWKFVIYGLINSLVLVYEFFTRKQRKKLFKKVPVFINNWLSNILTMLFICFLLIFFRANSINDAFYIISRVVSGSVLSAPVQYIVKYFAWTIPLILVEYLQKGGEYTWDMAHWGIGEKAPWNTMSEGKKKARGLAIKALIYSIIVMAIVLYAKKQNMAEYYYFKF